MTLQNLQHPRQCRRIDLTDHPAVPTRITIRPFAGTAGTVGAVSATIIAGTKPACSA
jgi:hypothetical protein